MAESKIPAHYPSDRASDLARQQEAHDFDQLMAKGRKTGRPPAATKSIAKTVARGRSQLRKVSGTR